MDRVKGSGARRLARTALLMSAVPLLACVDALSPIERRHTEVVMRTASPTIFTEVSTITDFRVGGEITNLGPRWVTYDRWCGWRIEQLVNGRWVAAYYPFCSIYSSEWEDIPPGATYYESLPAHASWRERTGAPVEGTYRVVWEILEEREGPRYVILRDGLTVTNSFFVRR
jgi:hypothetical protein